MTDTNNVHQPHHLRKNAKSEETAPTLASAWKKTWKNITQSIPNVLSLLLLISLMFTLVPANTLRQLFTGNIFIDSLIGAVVGSISSSNPLTSYIIGGELLKQGISMLAVTAFIVSWVTVGIVQLPAEALMLGKRYAITRNLTAFVTSILVAMLTVLIMGALS